jgi:hypothetical protein
MCEGDVADSPTRAPIGREAARPKKIVKKTLFFEQLAVLLRSDLDFITQKRELSYPKWQ